MIVMREIGTQRNAGRSENLRRGRRQAEKTGDRRDFTLVFLHFLRKYLGNVPSV